MSDNFCPGDLVTVKQDVDRCRGSWGSTEQALNARRPGLRIWDLWIPRSSIMTIIKITTPTVSGIQTLATVLHDGQTLEVFASELQRLDGTAR